jgi:hypothetical protein
MLNDSKSDDDPDDSNDQETILTPDDSTPRVEVLSLDESENYGSVWVKDEIILNNLKTDEVKEFVVGLSLELQTW